MYSWNAMYYWLRRSLASHAGSALDRVRIRHFSEPDKPWGWQDSVPIPPDPNPPWGWRTFMDVLAGTDWRDKLHDYDREPSSYRSISHDSEVGLG